MDAVNQDNREHFPHEFVISVCSVKSPSIQHDIYSVNYGSVLSKADDKAGYDISYFVLKKLLPQQPTNQNRG